MRFYVLIIISLFLPIQDTQMNGKYVDHFGQSIDFLPNNEFRFFYHSVVDKWAAIQSMNAKSIATTLTDALAIKNVTKVLIFDYFNIFLFYKF